MNVANAAAVMHFTLLEMKRARLWGFALVMVGIGCAIAEFAAAVSITETTENRLVFYAASMRLATVLVTALWVSTSVLREFYDNGVELALSRPISRSDWFIGKYLGYLSATQCLIVLVALPLIIQAPVPGLMWCLSLGLETVIMVAAAIAFAITLRQVTIAFSLVTGFYLLSRSIAAMVLMSSGPTLDLTLSSNQYFAWLVEVLATMLPDLERFTQSAWLVGPLPTVSAVGLLAVQAVVYASLLIAVGLFDFHRRDF